MEEEFVDLVNNCKAVIHKVCTLYCRDPEMRRDLFQEVVLQLWKSYPGFRKESHTATWVYKVALNTAISNYRKEARSPGKQGLSLREFEIPGPEENGEEKEKTGLLRQAIGRLTEIEKAVIMLYLDEKTYEEMSEITGFSISNIGVRLNRIKQKLNKDINKL